MIDRMVRDMIGETRSRLSDSDERLARMAAREIIRRRPQDYENTLLQMMTTAPESVRRVISRSIGQVGFEQFWQRFDQMDRATRMVSAMARGAAVPLSNPQCGKSAVLIPKS